MKCKKCGTELVEGAIYCHMCGKRQIPEPRRRLRRANGTGTVYKLSGRRKKPWVAAKQGIIIGYYTQKTEALDALERLNGKSLTERYNMTFAQVFEEWKAEHYKDISKDCIKSYNRAYSVFSPLHDRKFRDLRTADFQTALDACTCQSYASIAKHKQLITQMSTWAIREEIITTNFAKFVRLPEKIKKEKDIFTDAEIAKLEADGSETAKIILMLIYTGMRIGELFDLPLADYHGEYVVGGEKTEAGRNRIIPIRPEGRAYFAYFAERAEPGGLILSGYKGCRDSGNFRARNYYTLLKELGIKKHTPHSTRHTYASWARKAGIDPEILQKILGHADYSTTANIYVHTSPEELVQSVSNASITNK